MGRGRLGPKRSGGPYGEIVFWNAERGGIHPYVANAQLTYLSYLCGCFESLCKRFGIDPGEVPRSPTTDWINDLGLAKNRIDGPVDEMPETGDTGYFDGDAISKMFG